MRQAFVGFYWTLPVNWAGFRSLPQRVEEAAAKSRTIRYQVERVRRYVDDNAGVLVGESAFMDVRPDRATDAIKERLSRVRRLCNANHATMLYVRFDEVQLWRRNLHLTRYIEEPGIPSEALSPIPLTIDGRLFNPIKHFRAWRLRDALAMKELRQLAEAGLKRTAEKVSDGQRRYEKIADILNAEGIRTIRGGGWTPENVRKLLARTKLASPSSETPS